MKTKIIVALAVALATTSGCGWNNVPPGYGGIKVNFYGTAKGVDELPTVTGMQWYNPLTETILEYPVFNQRAVWTADAEEGSPTNEEISFASSEGLPFTADISLSYELQLEKLPHFYVKFRNDDIRGFTHGFMRDVARKGFSDIAPHYTAEELYSTKTEKLVGEVQEYVNNQVNQYGVHVNQFGIIGRPRPPKEIADRISAKVGSIQKAIQAENELRERTAEAAKRVADAKGDADSQVARAKGEAEANAILSASINNNLILWRELQVKKSFVDKWNGAAPYYLSTGGGALPTPIIDMTK
jgi:regulator of protease activity HflC (stomatin/prohibitin superfamily)